MKKKIDRTPEHLAGVSQHVDPGGRRVGIKTFRLKEIWYFDTIFRLVLRFTDPKYPQFIIKLAWCYFVKNCIKCHRERPGPIVVLRRFFGLTDYSIITAKKFVKKLPPEIFDSIMFANYEVKIFDKNEAPDEKKNKSKKTSTWTEIMSSYYLGKGTLPDDVLSMTIPQLAAIAETFDSQSTKQAQSDIHRNEADRLRETYGMKPLKRQR